MQQEKKIKYPSNAFGRFWMKVPLIIRSILIGFGVSSLGISIWTIVVTNLPGPWSVLLMGTILIFFWMYFSGKWSPSNTQAFRRLCTREIKLNKTVWIWALGAAFLIVLLLNISLMLTFRIVEFQPDIFKNLRFLNDLPALQAWSIIIGISMVAGICEEMGYRGYLQKPLEQRFGPLVAIAISSIIFIVIHVHQAWLVSIVLSALFISILIGYLAYATNSLLPGIIAHVSWDIIMSSYWWSDVIGTFERKPIGVTGIDGHFAITVIVLLLATALFIVCIWKLLQLKKQSEKVEVQSLKYEVGVKSKVEK